MRAAFTALVASHAPTDKVLRYASIGSGGLLCDLQVLLHLERSGRAVALVVLVDLRYAHDTSAPAALQALLGERSRVVAFSTLSAYREAASQDAALRVNLYVHCDADGIDRDLSRQAAAVALVSDGVGVKLNEDASLEVWRHAELCQAQTVGDERREGVAAEGAPRPWPEWRPSQLDAVLRGLAGRCLQCVEVNSVHESLQTL